MAVVLQHMTKSEENSSLYNVCWLTNVIGVLCGGEILYYSALAAGLWVYELCIIRYYLKSVDYL